jgi:hypothetical protein
MALTTPPQAQKIIQAQTRQPIVYIENDRKKTITFGTYGGNGRMEQPPLFVATYTDFETDRLQCFDAAFTQWRDTKSKDDFGFWIAPF